MHSLLQVMFLGMSLCLPLAYWQQWKAKQLLATGNGADEPLLGGDVVRPLRLPVTCNAASAGPPGRARQLQPVRGCSILQVDLYRLGFLAL